MYFNSSANLELIFLPNSPKISFYIWSSWYWYGIVQSRSLLLLISIGYLLDALERRFQKLKHTHSYVIAGLVESTTICTTPQHLNRYSSTSPATWDGAREACELAGGSLVDWNNNLVLNEFKGFVQNTLQEDAWTALHNPNDVSCFEVACLGELQMWAHKCFFNALRG